MNSVTIRSTPAPQVFRTDAIVRFITLGAIAAVIAASFLAALHGDEIVNWGGWTLTQRFLHAALSPALDSAILSLTASSALTTIAFALCGSAVSVAIGAVGGVLASETWWELVAARSPFPRSWFVWLMRCIRFALAVPRGIHELVWGLFFINVLGLDPLVAVLAIGIPFGAITAKVFSETLDEMPRRNARCFRASGASAAASFAYGILPRALPLLTSYAFYRLECAIRSAAVLGLVGAGGLGYQVLLSLQSLQYEQVWTFLYALMLLVAVTDWGSSRVMNALRAPSATTTQELDRRTRWTAVGIVASLAALVVAALYLNLDLAKPLEPVRLSMLKDVLATSLPPRFSDGDVSKLFMLSIETLVMSITAIVMAGTGALLVSCVSSMALFDVTRGEAGRARSLRGFALRTFTAAVRALLIGVRALSDGIWVLLALFVLFPGTFAGAFALAAYNFGIIGRLLSQVNEDADKRPFCALRAQDASFGKALLYGFLPLILPKYLAYILYRWEVCLRATVVVGIVGAGGLGLRLEDQLAAFDYRGATATLTFFVILTFIADAVSSWGRRALREA